MCARGTICEGGRPDATRSEVQKVIGRLARQGAQRLLDAALEAEEHVGRYAQVSGVQGRPQVVSSGHAPERTVLTGWTR